MYVNNFNSEASGEIGDKIVKQQLNLLRGLFVVSCEGFKGEAPFMTIRDRKFFFLKREVQHTKSPLERTMCEDNTERLTVKIMLAV